MIEEIRCSDCDRLLLKVIRSTRHMQMSIKAKCPCGGFSFIKSYAHQIFVEAGPNLTTASVDIDDNCFVYVLDKNK